MAHGGALSMRFVLHSTLGLILSSGSCLMPAHAEESSLSGAGLEGSASLGGAKLKPTKVQGGSLQRGKLESSKLTPSQIDGGKLQPGKCDEAQAVVQAARLSKLATELSRGDLTQARVQAAAASAGVSILGELFYGVARELESVEGGVTETAIGYYMAALADPAGARYAEAKKRLLEILLAKDLSTAAATALFDGGVGTLKELCRMDLGLSREGIAHCGRDLDQIQIACREQVRDLPPAPPASAE